MEISVIIPMYNSESTIEECVQSILKQKGVYEILLCDDGSTDQTAQRCQKLASSYPCIRYIKGPHAGTSAARNRGLRQAKGTFISFIDSDDTIDEKMYEEMFREFCEDVDLVMCSYVLSYRNIQRQMLFPFTQKRKAYAYDEFMQEIIPALVSEYSLTNNRQKIIMGSVCRCLFRNHIIQSNQLAFSESIRFTEDLQFLLDYLLQSRTIVLMNQVFYHYQKTRPTTTQCYMPNYFEDMVQSHMLLLNKISSAQPSLAAPFKKSFSYRRIMNFYEEIVNQSKVDAKDSFWKRRAYLKRIFQEYQLQEELHLFHYDELFSIPKKYRKGFYQGHITLMFAEQIVRNRIKWMLYATERKKR